MSDLAPERIFPMVFTFDRVNKLLHDITRRDAIVLMVGWDESNNNNCNSGNILSRNTLTPFGLEIL